MTDHGLKLTLRISPNSFLGPSSKRIFDDNGRLIAVASSRGNPDAGIAESNATAQHRAEVIVAALTADAEEETG